jgi:ribosomal protein S18 acetylase RimI-like enzyme
VTGGAIEIVEESPERLSDYARVSIGFFVREAFDQAAIEALRHGEDAAATVVKAPYKKDYDQYPGAHPTDWPEHLDKARWTILAAYQDGDRVGGAAVVIGDANLELLNERPPETALLLDLRVAPEARHQGVGTALLRAVESSAARGGARCLLVETQQVNVPACRFYLRHGFALVEARPHAYPELPDEVQLLWAKPLLLNA